MGDFVFVLYFCFLLYLLIFVCLFYHRTNSFCSYCSCATLLPPAWAPSVCIMWVCVLQVAYTLEARRWLCFVVYFSFLNNLIYICLLVTSAWRCFCSHGAIKLEQIHTRTVRALICMYEAWNADPALLRLCSHNSPLYSLHSHLTFHPSHLSHSHLRCSCSSWTWWSCSWSWEWLR